MTSAQPRVLVLFAHPSIERSEVNVHLRAVCEREPGVTLVDLYHEYPRHRIDIDREQQRLLDHDIVVFMFPLYWYSTPAILKEWQDLVLEYGFAYGSGGNALHGKTLICATTAGGAADAYRTGGYNRFELRELLRPLEQTAFLCGMRYLPPFALFGSRTAVEEGRVEAHVADWQRVLQALRDKTLNLERAETQELLNENLDQLMGGEPW